MTQRRVRSRKSTTLMAIALMAPLGLVACSGGAGGSGDSGDASTITVQDTFTTEPGNTNTQDQLEDCAETIGVTIERTPIPGGEIIPKTLQQASSKTLPDVLNIDNPDLQQLAAGGALAPLDDLGVSADGYAEGIVAANSHDGKLYGLQPTTQTLALFYNKDILDEAGLQPPATWEEFKATAQELTEGDQYGVAFSAPPSYEGTWQFLPFMWSNGGDEKDINTPETAEALQLWVDLVDSGSASRSVLNWGQEDVNDQFIAGKAAMMINGPWQLPVLSENPDVNYEIASVPVPNAGDTAVLPLGGGTWVLPQTGDTAKQENAAKLIECMNSDENMLYGARTSNAIPTKESLAEDAIAQDPDMETFIGQLPGLRSRTGELGPDWTTAATAIYTAVQDALTGKAAPQEALERAQNG
jgi:multiple sugar transport system substrate-binding protein